MYSTPLKSRIDKNRASFLLSLLIKPEEKIKFAFCTDLIIENSLYSKGNEHYFCDPLIREFWWNYDNQRMFLYTTVLQHLRLDKTLIMESCEIMPELKSINRSSIYFISNNLSRNHLFGAELTSEFPSNDDIKRLFVKTNNISNLQPFINFEHSSDLVVLECTVENTHTKPMYNYFKNIISKGENVIIISDHPFFRSKFKKQIHINDEYYLCYDKEIK